MPSSGLATRRAHAPLPPINIQATAPAPEIHTSFDDCLLQVSTPTLSRPFSDPARPPLSPVGKISSSRAPTRPASPASSRPSLHHRQSHARQMSARSLSQRPRPNTSATSRPPPPAPAAIVAGAPPEPTLRPRRSRPSLFSSLFSRPNVQRARGYGGGEPPAEPARNASLTRTLSRSGSQKRSRPLSLSKTNDAASQPQQLPADDARHASSQRSDMLMATAAESTGQTPGAWSPPPLSLACPQAVKSSTLEAPPATQSSASKSKISLGSIAETQERPKSRPGTSRFARPASKRAELADAREPTLLTQDAGKKIYVLVPAGYLLEYAGEGSLDRLPERVLRLTKDSAAYASDLIPGRHWVLQVVQSPTSDPFQSLHQPKSFLQRWNGGGRRREVTGLLLIHESPEDMDEWMTCMRREIERMGGTSHSSRPTTAARGHKKAEHERLTRRAFPVSKSPSLRVPSPAKSGLNTPTLTSDSGSTGALTGSGALPELALDWTPGKAATHMRKLSNVQKLSLQTQQATESPTSIDPTPTDAAPDTAMSAPLTERTSASPPRSEWEDADFEYLFPAPGHKKSASPSIAPTPSTFLSAPSQLPTPSTAVTPASAASEKRVSTYHMAEQSHGMRAQESEGSPTATRGKSSSSSAMEPIDETEAFFSQRQPSQSMPTLSVSSVDVSSALQSQRSSVASDSGKSLLQKAPSSPGVEVASSEASASYFPPRSSSRMSTLPLSASESGAASKRNSYRAASGGSPQLQHGASPNAFALASVPETSNRSESPRSSNRMSKLIHSTSPIPLQAGKTSPLNAGFKDDDSARSSRRTSVFTNGGPLPLYASSNASISPATSGYTSWNSSQRTSIRMSITPTQARLATIGSQSMTALSEMAMESSSAAPAMLRRPTSMSVSNDRVGFVGSKKPSPRSSALPPRAEPSKRDSTTVPIVRPPSVTNRRLVKSRATSTIGLPPQQPPPNVPLPCLPSGGRGRSTENSPNSAAGAHEPWST